MTPKCGAKFYRILGYRMATFIFIEEKSVSGTGKPLWVVRQPSKGRRRYADELMAPELLSRTEKEAWRAYLRECEALSSKYNANVVDAIECYSRNRAEIARVEEILRRL